MKKLLRKISIKYVPVFFATAIFAGLLVVLGWVFDITILKSVIPTFVTMKFTTAFSFVFSGMLLFSIYRLSKNPNSTFFLLVPMSSLTLLVLVSTIIVFSLLSIESGIGTLFIDLESNELFTNHPGRPSVGTLFNFFLITIVGLLSIKKVTQQQLKNFWSFGLVITTIGILAIIGYVIKIPALFYYVEGFSTAMAIHTSLLFVIIGIGMMRLSLET